MVSTGARLGGLDLLTQPELGRTEPSVEGTFSVALVDLKGLQLVIGIGKRGDASLTTSALAGDDSSPYTGVRSAKTERRNIGKDS